MFIVMITSHTCVLPGLWVQVYMALCIISFAFPALATITKEHIFKEAAKKLGGGQQLDVLVVNSYCSTAQVRATAGCSGPSLQQHASLQPS